MAFQFSHGYVKIPCKSMCVGAVRDSEAPGTAGQGGDVPVHQHQAGDQPGAPGMEIYKLW